MTALVADPMIGMRGGPGSGPQIGEVANQAMRAAQQVSSPPGMMGGLGGICNEDIRVPDKMVGLSEYFATKSKEQNEEKIIKRNV